MIRCRSRPRRWRRHRRTRRSIPGAPCRPGHPSSDASRPPGTSGVARSVQSCEPPAIPGCPDDHFASFSGPSVAGHRPSVDRRHGGRRSRNRAGRLRKRRLDRLLDHWLAGGQGTREDQDRRRGRGCHPVGHRCRAGGRRREDRRWPAGDALPADHVRGARHAAGARRRRSGLVLPRRWRRRHGGRRRQAGPCARPRRAGHAGSDGRGRRLPRRPERRLGRDAQRVGRRPRFLVVLGTHGPYRGGVRWIGRRRRRCLRRSRDSNNDRARRLWGTDPARRCAVGGRGEGGDHAARQSDRRHGRRRRHRGVGRRLRALRGDVRAARRRAQPARDVGELGG